MPTLTPEQIEERRSGLGGTDMAALAGVSRWATPVSVFFDKRPDLAPVAPDQQTAPMMAMGHLLEPVVADLFTEATGVRLRRRAATIRCREHPWEFGHVDRMVHGDPGVIFEAKWAQSKDGWGATGTTIRPDDRESLRAVPPGYLVQVQWYLHVVRARAAFIGALLSYADFRWYTVQADPAMQATLVRIGDSFWHDHVVPGVIPEPDGSAQYDQALRRRFRQDDGTEKVATPQVRDLLRRLRDAEQDHQRTGETVDTLRQQVQTAMGTATRLVAPEGVITWKTNKAGAKVDWQAVATSTADLFMLSDRARQSIIAQHTTPTEGARPFRVKWTEEE